MCSGKVTKNKLGLFGSDVFTVIGYKQNTKKTTQANI